MSENTGIGEHLFLQSIDGQLIFGDFPPGHVDDLLSTVDGKATWVSNPLPQLTSDIQTLQTLVATNKTSLDGKLSSLESILNTKLDDNSDSDLGRYQELSGRITAVEGVNNIQTTLLDQHTLEISTIKSDITTKNSTLDGKVTSLEQLLNTKLDLNGDEDLSRYTELSGRIQTNTTDISNLKTTTTSLDGKISALETLLNTKLDNNSDEDLNKYIELSGRIQTNSSDISTQSSLIQSLQSQVATNNSTLDGKLSSLENILNTKLDDNSDEDLNRYIELSGRIQNIVGINTTQSSDIESLKTTNETHSADILTLKTENTSQTTEINTIKSTLSQGAEGQVLSMMSGQPSWTYLYPSAKSFMLKNSSGNYVNVNNRILKAEIVIINNKKYMIESFSKQYVNINANKDFLTSSSPETDFTFTKVDDRYLYNIVVNGNVYIDTYTIYGNRDLL